MGDEPVEAPAARAAALWLSAIARRGGAGSSPDEEAAGIGGIGAQGPPRLGRSEKGMAGGVFRTWGRESAPWAAQGPVVRILAITSDLLGALEDVQHHLCRS